LARPDRSQQTDAPDHNPDAEVLQEKLRNTSFRRIHRNALVNIDHIRKMSTYKPALARDSQQQSGIHRE
jgi:DNA-binding LytR/AlgR family response regulator